MSSWGAEGERVQRGGGEREVRERAWEMGGGGAESVHGEGGDREGGETVGGRGRDGAERWEL